ncbi:RPS11 [Symbiodinium sp. KB8]|nr:RPS11 [Symbiodinium sp. KB8]
MRNACLPFALSRHFCQLFFSICFHLHFCCAACFAVVNSLSVNQPPAVTCHSRYQTEKAFQKQEGVFLGHRRLLGKKKGKSVRYYKNVGLGFKTPKAAIEGTYIDKKCPFTGNVAIRGRILKGVVISTKMNRTIVIRRDFLRYVSKYRRYEKRHKNVSVHCSPAFRVKEGDVVTTVRFNVLTVEPVSEANAQQAKKTFRVF